MHECVDRCMHLLTHALLRLAHNQVGDYSAKCWCLQELNYLASVTLNRGKVYALFVKSPAKVGPALLHL